MLLSGIPYAKQGVVIAGEGASNNGLCLSSGIARNGAMIQKNHIVVFTLFYRRSTRQDNRWHRYHLRFPGLQDSDGEECLLILFIAFESDSSH